MYIRTPVLPYNQILESFLTPKKLSVCSMCGERVTSDGVFRFRFEPRNCIEQFISSINRSLKCSSLFRLTKKIIKSHTQKKSKGKMRKKRDTSYTELCSSGAQKVVSTNLSPPAVPEFLITGCDSWKPPKTKKSTKKKV